MTPTANEQRHRYLGYPPRPWITLRLAARDGPLQEFKLIADTGNPLPFVIASSQLAKFTFGAGTDVNTNFGPLQAAWFQLAMPEFGLDILVQGFVSDDVVTSTRVSHQDFDGLARLSLLRLMEYGGNADEFWIRRSVPKA